MTPRLLQKARLMLPFQARMSKGGVMRGQQCHLVEYILYASRNACNLCHTDAKAERQVVIEVDGRMLHAGLNCFEAVSGYSAKQLENMVKGHLGVALRLRNLSDEGFADEVTMLRHIEKLLNLVGPGSERDRMRAELSRLKAANHFTSRDLRYLEEVLDLLALLQFGKSAPDAYSRMVDAVFGQPGRQAEEARSKLDRYAVSNPARLSLSQAAELRKAMRVLLELQVVQLNQFNSGIRPWDFPDREAYIQALSEYYREQADAGTISQMGRLQAQYDLVHEGRRPPEAADILTNLGIPCILPVYDHPDIEALDLTGFQGLRLLERGNQLPRGAMDEQFYLSSEVYEATIRTDRERSRINNRGVTRPPEPGDTASVLYRALALWRPDAWHPVYSLWHEYGRETLLAFPKLGQLEPGTP